MAKGNRFGKSLANIKKANESASDQSNLSASQLVSKIIVDFHQDESLESKEQVLVSFRTSEANRKALRQAALDRDIPLAELIKQALAQYLQTPPQSQD